MPGAIFAPFRKRRDTGSTVLATPAAPATPSTPSPADTATAYFTLLSWVSALATNFDVYLGTANPPTTIVAPQIQSTSYVPTLLPSTTYYWKIVASNAGGSATGPVWSFTTPAATAVIWSLAGSVVTSRVRFGSASIQETLSASPNTASANFQTTAPTAGQAIKIGLGTLDNASLIFGGEIQDVDQTYVGTPDGGSLWPVSLIDQTFRLNKRRPFGTWVSTSASIIGRYLVAVFAPSDFTSTGIPDGLPAVTINLDGSQDFMTCLRALATAISTSSAIGQAKVTYAKDVQLFLTNPDTVTPDAIDINHPPLNDPSQIKFATDLSQVRTRVYGKGATTTVPTAISVSEITVPVVDASQFTSTGGRAITGSTSGGAQTQVITYAGVQLGGTVTTVTGTLQTPSAPSASSVSASGGGITGQVFYKQTFVGPLGESELSAASSSFSGGAMGVPQSSSPSFAPTTGGSLSSSTSYFYAFRSVDSLGGTSSMASSSGWAASTGVGQNKIGLSTLDVISDARAVARIILRSAPNAAYSAIGPWYEVGRNAPSATTFGDTAADLTGAVDVGAAGTGGRSATVTLATGPVGTTSRKAYRTLNGGLSTDPYFLVGSIGDNVTATFVDAAANSALTSPAPSASTVGTAAAATSLGVADLAQVGGDSGWVQAGTQLIRFSGRSATTGAGTLTGITASGVGSITATLAYNSAVTAVPALTGVNSNNGLFTAMAKGSSVAIWVQRDDTAAQTALGLLELDDNGNATDGIREYTITDARRSEPSLTALCDADLAQFSRPIVSATYYTRDIKTRAGRTVSINVVTGTFDPATFDHATFDIAYGFGNAGSFTIQSVTLTFDGPGMYPLRQVQASSVSFTLQDLLRKVVLS